MKKPYTGIGSRETPDDVLELMQVVAKLLADTGEWHLRSGGADRADQAFERGAWDTDVPDTATIFLPWPGFSGHTSVDSCATHTYVDRPQPEAYDIAAHFHPNWGALRRGGRALHARNVHQVLGPDVTNPVLSHFVLCWTPNASGSGGTGQAIRIARAYGVDVEDLAEPSVRNRVEAWLDRRTT